MYGIFSLIFLGATVLALLRNVSVRSQLWSCSPALLVTDVIIRIEAPPGRWTMDRPSLNRIRVGSGYAHVEGRGPISARLGWRWHFWAPDTLVEALAGRNNGYVALRSVRGISKGPPFRMGVAVLPSAGSPADLIDALRCAGFSITMKD